MKKFKFSWLVILAVVFAVGSAFTTNTLSRVKTHKVTYLWYANDAHNPGNPLTASQVDASVSFTDAQITPAFLSSHCPTSSVICVAKFQQGPTGSQQAYKLGMYQ